MRKTKSVTIGDHEYVLVQLPTSKGLTTLTRITKILGPAFGEAFKTLKGDAEVALTSLGVHGIGELITQLSTRVSPDELVSLAEIFVEHTELVKDGGQTPLRRVYAEHFGGDFGCLFELLVAHINFNFASFFKGLGLTVPHV